MMMQFQSFPEEPTNPNLTKNYEQLFAATDMEQLTHHISEFLSRNYELEDLKTLVEALMDQKSAVQQHFGLIGLRKISALRNGHYAECIFNTKIMPKVVNMMDQEVFLKMKSEAIWLFTNIVGGWTGLGDEIICPAVPILINILKSSQDISTVENALWAFGNITADSVFYRDLVIDCQGVYYICNIMQRINEDLILETAAWVLSNLCRNQPLPSFQTIKPIIFTLARFVIEGDRSKDVLIDCFWAMQKHICGRIQRIQSLLDLGLHRKIIEFCDSANYYHQGLFISSMKIITELTSGTAAQIGRVFQLPKFIEKMEDFQRSDHRTIKKESFSILANVCAGNPKHMRVLLKNQAVMQNTARALLLDTISIKKEAFRMVLNVACFGMNYTENNKQAVFNFLKRTNIMSHIVSNLSENNADFLRQVLTSLLKVLEFGKKIALEEGGTNAFTAEFRDLGTAELLNQLGENNDEQVQHLATQVQEMLQEE